MKLLMSSPNTGNTGDDSEKKKTNTSSNYPKRRQETISCPCTVHLNDKHNNKPLEVGKRCLGSLGPSHMPAQHISAVLMTADVTVPLEECACRLHQGVTKRFVRDMDCFNQSFSNGCIPFFAPIEGGEV